MQGAGTYSSRYIHYAGDDNLRTIGVVTCGRSDYGIYLPVLREIQSDPDLQLRLIVSGMHLSPEFGLTVRDIEADGFEVSDRVEMLLSSDTPEGVANSMGLGTIGFSRAYASCRPDLLLVLGDSFEMHAAAVAAVPFRIPVAHIHGGEITEGAIDDALRHSITKLSHLHFVATQEYQRRVLQMGEEPWRVIVSGAPSLDNLGSMEFLSRKELETSFSLRLEDDPLIVTYHPVTLEYEETEKQVQELLAALQTCDLPVVFTMPNADTNGRVIRRMLTEFVQSHAQAQMVENLGSKGYFSLMACARAMVGNSSSGIIEAPSLGLPTVNIGTRQRGRVRGRSVIDVGYFCSEIIAGIKQAISPEFRDSIIGAPNPYCIGRASTIIVKQLKKVSLNHKLVIKNFVDAPHPPVRTV